MPTSNSISRVCIKLCLNQIHQSLHEITVSKVVAGWMSSLCWGCEALFKHAWLLEISVMCLVAPHASLGHNTVAGPPCLNVWHSPVKFGGHPPYWFALQESSTVLLEGLTTTAPMARSGSNTAAFSSMLSGPKKAACDAGRGSRAAWQGCMHPTNAQGGPWRGAAPIKGNRRVFRMLHEHPHGHLWLQEGVVLMKKQGKHAAPYGPLACCMHDL